ncbi:cobalt-precorrin-6A reductase [Rhizobium halophytocola]|uniref:Precorrin-6A/cobalt-precorrin-6A reductase n=1 Tax=Rhizobium halophytocola TaxID=735519 RepID=A0ABS4DZJ4_9HYPH|nr:cobalt-precorrin-6A reductase [Rhizobium halophytocola]MBP1851117.1 precorrin-6A/cobalt-precorrin-6A reductase [Rhizobium halophytocola]
MRSRDTVLILGGTAEAADLAARLVAETTARVITSLAGRTMDPVLPPGEVRIGGFGGADGLAGYLKDEQVSRVIDATHPFARRISQNAVSACAAAGIPLERVERRPWLAGTGDRWTDVASLDAAAAALPRGARVFLALGRQYLDAFRARTDCHFVLRMVDPPEVPLGFASHDLLIGKPADADSEAALLSGHRITHVVCRNSGGAAGFGKIEAARMLGLPVILIARPEPS